MHFAIIGSRGFPSTYGGFETLVRHLAPYLVEQGHQVTVYCRDPRVRRTKIEINDEVQCIFTPGVDRKSLSTLTYGLSAALDVTRRRVDGALVVNVANGYFLPILRRAGIATAVNVDGLEWERAKWGRTAKTMFRVGANLTARFADGLVMDSRAIGQYWLEHFHRQGTFIPYGGDISYPASNRVQDVGLQPGTYLLVVARLVPENNVQMAVEAAKQSNFTFPLVIVGSNGFGGDFETELAEIDRAQANFHWFGHVTDQDLLAALWGHSGAYFHGHSVGGTNPALLQAMGSGAPVIAFDSPYNREVLGPGGSFVRNPIELLKTFRHLCDSSQLRSIVVQQNREIILRHYSWPMVNRLYRDLLMGLLKVTDDTDCIVSSPDVVPRSNITQFH